MYSLLHIADPCASTMICETKLSQIPEAIVDFWFSCNWFGSSGLLSRDEAAHQDTTGFPSQEHAPLLCLNVGKPTFWYEAPTDSRNPVKATTGIPNRSKVFVQP